ncbi:MAG: hypothetical protein A2Y10_15475 [Planctomycetes bacterium GWF2_41_51]|nr:MAG: hypothetical protein A2Y10_15475 [Planctomycetes bacterium GWF2_41_51]HBG27563.1 hypothetical protein [Phycisphaerales bacterium]
MLKQKLIILLIGLIFISSVSSFFIVTCHGSDGHIMPEPAGHNHCECTDSGLGLCGEYDHCKDIVYASHFTVPVRKNKMPTHKNITSNILLVLFQPHTAFLKSMIADSNESLSFFAALQTVILIV